MREIKFRAWDKKQERFLDENDNVPNFLDLTPCDTTGQFVPMYMEISETKVFDTDIVLNQYTGLKDKNGLEIYDGDIVLVSYYGKPRKVEVRILDCECQPFNQYSYSEDGYRGPEEAKIIGNIYENPELLKGE